MTKHTITLSQLDLSITYSIKDDGPRGVHTISGANLRIGDKIVIDNYFHEIVEEPIESKKENKNMTKKEQLIELFDEMSDPDKVYLYNQYCQETNNYDDEIYPMDMFEEIMHGVELWDVITKMFYGDFNPNHEYFKFNGYANLVSIRKWDLDRFIDIEDIIKYILENDEDFDENDIRYILDEIGENENV